MKPTSLFVPMKSGGFDGTALLVLGLLGIFAAAVYAHSKQSANASATQRRPFAATGP